MPASAAPPVLLATAVLMRAWLSQSPVQPAGIRLLLDSNRVQSVDKVCECVCLCVCVCMCVWVWVYAHVCVYVCVSPPFFSLVHACICLCTCVFYLSLSHSLSLTLSVFTVSAYCVFVSHCVCDVKNYWRIDIDQWGNWTQCVNWQATLATLPRLCTTGLMCFRWREVLVKWLKVLYHRSSCCVKNTLKYIFAWFLVWSCTESFNCTSTS